MRHKYPTQAIVLARSPLGEESALLTLLTLGVGLMRARAQGLRKPGARLVSSLQTFCESEMVLVRGKEGWRVSGALLLENYFATLSHSARERAGRSASLLLRLVHGETPDSRFYETFRAYLIALKEFDEDQHDSIECLAALRFLHLLGLDSGGVQESESAVFTKEALTCTAGNRRTLIARVNQGIAASGL